MTIGYTFLTGPDLVFIQYHGHITSDELMTAATQFANEPALRPMTPHFFDFSAVRSYDIDFPKYLKFMAKLADIYPSGIGEQLFVFYAPPGKPAEMAEMARRPWEGSQSMFIRVASSLDRAFDILGGSRDDVIEQIKART